MEYERWYCVLLRVEEVCAGDARKQQERKARRVLDGRGQDGRGAKRRRGWSTTAEEAERIRVPWWECESEERERERGVRPQEMSVSVEGGVEGEGEEGGGEGAVVAVSAEWE